jgi:hypothetical protein
VSLLTNILFTIASFPQAPGQPTVGQWFYRDFYDRAKLKSPWRPNALQIPVTINEGDSDSFKLAPGLRAKIQKIVDAMAASAPKPTFAHQMVHVSTPEPKKNRAGANDATVSLGDFVLKYDSKGVLEREKVAPHGFSYSGVGSLHINMAIDDSSEGFFRTFSVIDTLLYEDFARTKQRQGPKYRLIPGSLSIDDASARFVTYKSQLDPSLYPVTPKRISPKASIYGRADPELKNYVVEGMRSDLRILWTHDGKLPFTDYLTRGKVLDLMEHYSLGYVMNEKNFEESSPLPTDEAKREKEVRRREANVARNMRFVDAVKKIREHYAGSLDKIAIMDNRYENQILAMRLYSMADELMGKNPSQGEKKFPIEKFFIEDPRIGFRIARFDSNYFSGTKPGEVRLVYGRFMLSQRFKNSPTYGKPEQRWYTAHADVVGSFRHAMMNTLDWGIVDSILGP